MTTLRWTEADLSRLQRTGGWQIGDSIFGLYRVEAIKSGAMGVVYLCGGEAGGQAIKTILADPLDETGARAQMKAEALAWLALGPHPNVVPCELLLESPYDKRLLLLLPRVYGHPQRGVSLGEWMRNGPLAPPTIAQAAAGIAEGMRFAWETARLVHRDLKPENVLMAVDGTPRVTDFGLARSLASGAADLRVAGTPAYMAPEAWRGGEHVSGQSDVYAFGVILWELLTGQHPFAEHFDSMVSLRYAHVAVPPYDPRSLNPAASEILARVALLCLAKEPSQRPDDFAAVLRALGRELQPFPLVGSSNSEFGRAQGLMNMGRWSEAEAIVEALRAADPDRVTVDLLRMRLLEGTGRLGEDHALLEKIAALDAQDGVTRRAKQHALTLVGRHQHALAVVEEALGHESAGDLMHCKGRLLWTLNRHEEALVALAEANRFPALVDRARLLIALKRDDEGLDCLMAALQMNSNDEEALVAVAVELDDKGRHAEALSYVGKALHVSPGFWPARRMRPRLIGSLGRRSEAEAELRALLAEYPENVELWADLMQVLGDDAKEGQIEECAMHMVLGRAWTARGHLLKGKMTAISGDAQAALVSYDRALVEDPTLAFAWDEKGEAYMTLNDPELAVAAYRNALSLSPGNDGMATHLAAAEQRLESLRLQRTDRTAAREAAWHWHREAVRELHEHQYEAAEQHYRRAVHADPDQPQHAASLAACLHFLAEKRPDALTEALALFADADRRLPDDPVLLFNWASALGRARRAGEASLIVTHLQSLTPGDPDLEILQRNIRANLAGQSISPVDGQRRQDGGAGLRADGVLVDPDLRAYAVIDGIGENLPGSVFQPALNEMSGFFHAALGQDYVAWPFGVDRKLSYEGNVLRTALRIANETLVSQRPGPRFAVAAALLRGKVVWVASAGEALCLLVRGGHLLRLGVESTLEFEIRAYQLEPGDLVVLASHRRVEPIVADACAPPATPETAAMLLGLATGTRVVVIRGD